ncbi:MAG TPA: TIGR03435 family protein [Vicinamibacterales bacterium]|nr:TIGR03435 family protein [Vicinamibacterales bacterium]
MVKALLTLALAALVTTHAPGQAPPRQTSATLSFEAASVRANPARRDRLFRFTPEHVDIVGSTLAYIVSQAYEMPIPRTVYPSSPMKELFSGEYDIHAVAGRPSTRSDLLAMLRQLLQDRFALTVHTEPRIGPAYNLTVTRAGSRLRRSEQTFETGPPVMGLDFLEGRGSSVGQMAFLLTARLGRPVIDRTGLGGLYDYRLKIETLDARPGADPKAAGEYWSESSIFTDIQEQLGLRLEGTRAAIDHLVIDRVARPRED